MSFIKDLLDKTRSQQQGITATASPQETLLETMLGRIGAGGLNSFLEQFRRAGLTDAVQSWIGTGPNQPISAEQVRSALGERRMDTLAQQSGLPKDETGRELAQILPELINHLTPDGKLPGIAGLPDMLGDLLADLHGSKP